MNIEDWFDPKNNEHIEFYVEFRKRGYIPQKWYDYFVENNITLTKLWTIEILNKMSEAWIGHMMEN